MAGQCNSAVMDGEGDKARIAGVMLLDSLATHHYRACPLTIDRLI
jgi:hypothetical protein